MSSPHAHRDLILDQFTRQGVPFSTAPGIRDEEARRLLVEASGAGPADTVLDVACGPGLVVAAFAAVARHNRMEKLRDPSHVRAMPLAELAALFPRAGLPAPAITRCEVRAEVEGLLTRSFPDPGDADRIREMFAASLAAAALGVGARRHDGAIHFAYPVAILASPRAA